MFSLVSVCLSFCLFTGSSHVTTTWACSNFGTPLTLVLRFTQGLPSPTPSNLLMLMSLGHHHTGIFPLFSGTSWRVGCWPSTERPSCFISMVFMWGGRYMASNYMWNYPHYVFDVILCHYYRPQGKVTFSETCVILFTGGGVLAAGECPYYWHQVAVTAAIVTHPTGMNSCYWFIFKPTQLTPFW